MVSEGSATRINGHRLDGMCEPHRPRVEVVRVHVSRCEVDPPYWPLTDLTLLPTTRKVRLKSNPNIVASVRLNVCQGEGDDTGKLYIIAAAFNSEWVGDPGGCYCFGLAEQLEAEALALEGL